MTPAIVMPHSAMRFNPRPRAGDDAAMPTLDADTRFNPRPRAGDDGGSTNSLLQTDFQSRQRESARVRATKF